MNIAIQINQLLMTNIFFFERIKNTVMEDSYFIRFLYSNSLFSLNGIYVVITLKISALELFYNKYKCFFREIDNRETIKHLILLEQQILKKFAILNKNPYFCIKDQLNQKCIKIFSDNKELLNIDKFILKISGIWETKTDYGLTFKFIEINHLS
jgi:hypothetical protein